MNILISSEFFLPAFKSGGPVKSLSGLIESLPSDFSISVITSDRDRGDLKPYPSLSESNELKVGNASVSYIKSNWLNIFLFFLKSDLNRFDIIYLNSLYSPVFSLSFLLLSFVKRFFGLRFPLILLAPRGELSIEAVNIKPFKKKLYLFFLERFCIVSKIFWQASSKHEFKDIVRVFPSSFDSIYIAQDISLSSVLDFNSIPSKFDVPKFLFLSRIAPMKNLKFLLEVFQYVDFKCHLDVYGPIADDSYWKECLLLVDALPDNVSFSYLGPVSPDDVPTIFKQYHCFLLPTLGENFGHVIIESLASGCPVVISKNTYWTDVDGSIQCLDLNISEWVNYLKFFNSLSIQDYIYMTSSSLNFASSFFSSEANQSLTDNILMFNDICKRSLS